MKRKPKTVRCWALWSDEEDRFYSSGHCLLPWLINSRPKPPYCGYRPVRVELRPIKPKEKQP